MILLGIQEFQRDITGCAELPSFGHSSAFLERPVPGEEHPLVFGLTRAHKRKIYKACRSGISWLPR